MSTSLQNDSFRLISAHLLSKVNYWMLERILALQSYAKNGINQLIFDLETVISELGEFALDPKLTFRE